MHEVLEQLRLLVRDDRIPECVGLVEALFKQVSFLDVFRLVVTQLKAHLPDLEAYHPEIDWPRQYLEMLEQSTPIDYSNYDFRIYSEDRVFDNDGLPTPGSTAFFEALGLLHSALDIQESDYIDNKIELTVSALNNALGARLWATWAQKSPTNYKAWLDIYRLSREWLEPYSEAQLAKSREAVKLFRDDPIRKQIACDLYLEVANEIEFLLDKFSAKENQGS